MKNVIWLAVLLVVTSPASAGNVFGEVASVDKKGFTVKPERGKKVTMTFGPDMGKNKAPTLPPSKPSDITTIRDATPDQIKVGMAVIAFYQKKGDVLVCGEAILYLQHIGPREVDFSPMRAKGKETVPECILSIQIANRAGAGNRRPYRRRIVLKDGSVLKREIADIKRMLSGDGWKVKVVDDCKLLIEAYKNEPETHKDEPVVSLMIEAEGLPKEQQPIVKHLDPSK